jgi:hypothetical protein
MAFAASSLMVGTASAAKAPKPPKPITVTKAISFQSREAPVGKVQLEYTTAGTVTLKSVSVKAVKNHPLLTPGTRYDIALRLGDSTYTTFCSFTAPKNGTAVMCAKAKKTDGPETSPTDNLISANYAAAPNAMFGIWPSGSASSYSYYPEYGAALK